MGATGPLATRMAIDEPNQKVRDQPCEHDCWRLGDAETPTLPHRAQPQTAAFSLSAIHPCSFRGQAPFGYILWNDPRPFDHDVRDRSSLAALSLHSTSPFLTHPHQFVMAREPEGLNRLEHHNRLTCVGHEGEELGGLRYTGYPLHAASFRIAVKRGWENSNDHSNQLPARRPLQ